ncbi:hypothetical protein LIER_41988 [Lithospermum erythrorhizon]|uniref:Uncharacterized protein n=1 Tax=Lithospermum erythrorhizon TaxID=34254 RepID=A0AAV3RL43_LITER
MSEKKPKTYKNTQTLPTTIVKTYDLTTILNRQEKQKIKSKTITIQDLQKKIKDVKQEVKQLKEKQQKDSETIQIDTIALFDTGADLNCIKEGIVPQKFQLSTNEILSATNNARLEISNKCEGQFSNFTLIFLNAKLVMETEARKYVEETNASLKTSNEHLKEMEVQISKLQTLLAINSEGKHNAEVELESTSIKLKKSQGYLEKLEVELVELQKQLAIMNEAKVVAELEVGATNKNIQKSSDRLEGMECYLDELQNQLATSNEGKFMVELELEATNIKLKQSSDNLDEMEAYMEHLHNQLEMANEEKKKAKVEIGTATKNKDIVESQLVAKEVEMQTLLSRIIVLEDEIQRQRRLADEAVDKCKNLDSEISRFKQHKANFGDQSEITKLPLQ